MRRRKTKTVVRLGSLGMSNRAFQVGLRHAALPPGFSAFPWLHGWSLSSLDQRDSPANPGTTQRVGNDLPPQQQLCDVDAVVVMSIRARKSGKTIVYTDCAAAERSLSAAGQPLLPCRARVVAEQLLVQYVPGSSSHRPISLVACSKSFVFSCRRIYCAILSLHGILIEADEALRRFNGVPQKASIQRPTNPEIPP
jgi:hypothetical protein